MLNPYGSQRVFLCLEPADMRKSFDGLSALVREKMGHNPLSGSMFVFLNRRGDHLKVLQWDTDGFALFHKRLEKGRFRLPIGADGRPLQQADYTQLLLILQGIELKAFRRQKRFVLPAAMAA